MKKKKIFGILDRLKQNYPHAHCTLHHKTPFQLLIATILSAQCTDERVNKVTPELFRELPDPKSFVDASFTKLEKLIYSTGFYHQKAQNIKTSCTIIEKEFYGELPQTMENLIKLPGIGRKTANVILGTAFKKNEGVVVDTHVKRISFRLGLTDHTVPDKIEKDLMSIIPQENWTVFSHMIIEHGGKLCKARKPVCELCFLKDICPSSKKMIS